jgi:RNA recognition motif-containing protein
VSKKAQEPKDSSSDTSEDLPTHRQTPKKKKSKQQKKTRSPSNDRPSSKTTLFVANLPYATTDDDIKDLFKGYKVVSAHVTRMNNGRSKGYGFAEFEDEDEQQKALQNVKDIQLDGRAVYLKVALSTDEVSKKVEALDINDTKK